MDAVSVRYIVDDVDAAVEFYTGRLGFEVQMNPPRDERPAAACPHLWSFTVHNARQVTTSVHARRTRSLRCASGWPAASTSSRAPTSRAARPGAQVP